MNSSYVGIFLLIVFVLYQQNQNKKLLLKQLVNRKNREEKVEMLELAKRFVEKECIIYTFNSQVTGIIKEVTGGAILVENKNTIEAINLDFIVRIREYPRNKKGKKKSLVID